MRICKRDASEHVSVTKCQHCSPASAPAGVAELGRFAGSTTEIGLRQKRMTKNLSLRRKLVAC